LPVDGTWEGPEGITKLGPEYDDDDNNNNNSTMFHSFQSLVLRIHVRDRNAKKE